MESYLTHLFVLNIFLIFIDATIGYYGAPNLVRLADDQEPAAEPAVRGVRTMLALVVALYMFFNCQAFFSANSSFLLLVTGVLATDIVAQFLIRAKMKKRDQQ